LSITINIEAQLADLSETVRDEIARLLAGNQASKLLEAMKYSAISGGKYLRPFITYNVGKIFDLSIQDVIVAAASIEIIHCYSLIHDDLPSMDNDDLRRGKPSCHKAFDEATAILAGDALHTFAFEILSSENFNKDAEIRCKVINLLAKSIGMNGMAGGQMFDLQYEQLEVSEEEILTMQKMKTAYLFSVSAEIASILAKSNDIERLAIRNYGLKLGLAFQIIDDVIDVEGTEKHAGKKLGKDELAGKATLVSKFGIDYAKMKAHKLSQEAKSHLLALGDRDYNNLIAIADFVIARSY